MKTAKDYILEDPWHIEDTSPAEERAAFLWAHLGDEVIHEWEWEGLELVVRVKSTGEELIVEPQRDELEASEEED